MMKLRIVAVILGCLAAVAGRAADNPVATVDSLLALYDQAGRGEKVALARKLVPLCIEGDEVVVFGSASQLCRMAESAGTIPYEILTSVSPRVKRVYVSE